VSDVANVHGRVDRSGVTTVGQAIGSGKVQATDGHVGSGFAGVINANLHIHAFLQSVFNGVGRVIVRDVDRVQRNLAGGCNRHGVEVAAGLHDVVFGRIAVSCLHVVQADRASVNIEGISHGAQVNLDQRGIGTIGDFSQSCTHLGASAGDRERAQSERVAVDLLQIDADDFVIVCANLNVQLLVGV